MTLTAFTRSHADRSSDKGYQFEFFCDKCGTGVRTGFQANKLGIAAGLLRAASSVLGGAFGGAAQGVDQLRDTLRGEGWDAAFQDAIKEAKPRFRQCTRCGQWVCPHSCWNEARGLCNSCGASALAAEKPEENRRLPEPALSAAAAAAATSCPHCHASVDAGAKFCGECGKPVLLASTCAKCGAQLPGSGKFCPQCGTARA